MPDGAFYAFFDVSAYFGRTLGGATVTDSTSFCQAALEAAHVNLVPGSAFGAEGFVRLSFATSREQINGGLDRLEQLLASEAGACSGTSMRRQAVSRLPRSPCRCCC